MRRRLEATRLCQRAWSSRVPFSPTVSLLNDEVVKWYSFEKNLLTRLSNTAKEKDNPPRIC